MLRVPKERPKPAIKWAGGKTQILPSIFAELPEAMGTYVEPFVGGGAVFLALAAEKPFRKAIINDVSAELVALYRTIASNPHTLMERLDVLSAEYEEAPKPTYLKVRAQDVQTLTQIDLAARFLFLNKTDFNGLYRVNRRGIFNVPWGQKEKVNLYETHNVLAVARALSADVAVMQGDFEAVIDRAGAGDVVYADPPYLPKTKTSSFVGYSAGGFSLAEHARLAESLKQAVRRGATVVASNANMQDARDLYGWDGFEIKEVDERRNINCVGGGRGTIKELLIVGRPT